MTKAALLEVSAPLFLFHSGTTLILIDDSTLPFAGGRQQHFLDDLGQRGRLALDGTGQGVTTQRPKPHHFRFFFFTSQQRHAVIVTHQQDAVTVDHASRSRSVQGNDRNIFEVDVLPNI